MTKKKNNSMKKLDDLLMKSKSHGIFKYYLEDPIEDKPNLLIYYTIDETKYGNYTVNCTFSKISPTNAIFPDYKSMEKSAKSVIKSHSIFYPEQFFDKDTIEELKKQCIRFISMHGIKPIRKDGWVTQYVGVDGVEPNDYVHCYIRRLLTI